MKRVTLGLAGLLVSLLAAGGLCAETYPTLAGPEQVAMSDTLQYALENNRSNQVSDWANPDTGHSGAVVPVKTYTDAMGRPCREFVTTIIIGGRQEQGYGTACRQPDGSWQIVADEQAAAAPAAPPDVYVYAPPERYHYIYPSAYYYYPTRFYYPYHIYLSFDYVFRGGSLHFGSYYLDRPHFWHRYPAHVHTRIYLGARIFGRHPWYRKAYLHHRSHVRSPAYRRQYPSHQKRYDYRRPANIQPKAREGRDYRQRRDLKNQDRNRRIQPRSPAVRKPGLKQERRSPTGRDRQSIERTQRNQRSVQQPRRGQRSPDGRRVQPRSEVRQGKATARQPADRKSAPGSRVQRGFGRPADGQRSR